MTILNEISDCELTTGKLCDKSSQKFFFLI